MEREALRYYIRRGSCGEVGPRSVFRSRGALGGTSGALDCQMVAASLHCAPSEREKE